MNKQEKEITPEMKAYMEKYGEDDSPGWDAIEEALKRVYGEQSDRHYATVVPFMLGGKDPLDGISIYDSEKQTFHRHMISFGMSELYYAPESAGREFSRWGCEFTMRLIPFEGDGDAETKNGGKVPHEPNWAMNLMQNLARYVYNNKDWFEEYHFVPANGPIRQECDTKLVGIIFTLDPELGSINPPHGQVDFLQLFGITQKELDWLLEDPTSVRVKELADTIRKVNPLMITDLNRTEDYI